MNRKIAIILNDYTLMGGLERVTSNLANMFLQNHFPLDCIISLNKKNEVPSISYPNPLSIYHVKKTNLANFLKEKNITHTILQVQDLRIAYQIVREVNKQNIKVFPVLHSSPYLYIMRFEKPNSFYEQIKYKKTKYITKPKNLYYFKKLIKDSSKFITLTETVQKELQELMPKKIENRVIQLYNPIPFKFDFVKNKSNIIVFAGRFSPDKRVYQMVKVVASVIKNRLDWQLHLLGEGVEYDIIRKYINDNNIVNIKLFGKVDDVHQRLKLSKIAILYSFSESLPTFLMESAYKGNVLISSNFKGGPQDIISESYNGFIVNNDKEFASSLEMLISDEALVEQMGKNNEKFLKKFNQEQIIQGWLKLLD